MGRPCPPCSMPASGPVPSPPGPPGLQKPTPPPTSQRETPWGCGSHRAAAPTPSLPSLFSWRTVSTGSVPPHLSAQSFCLLSAAPCLQPQGLEASPILHTPTSVSYLPLTPNSTRPRPPVRLWTRSRCSLLTILPAGSPANATTAHPPPEALGSWGHTAPRSPPTQLAHRLFLHAGVSQHLVLGLWPFSAGRFSGLQ